MTEETQKTNNTMEEIVSLCKRRGFVFQSSEIYGGTGSVWDFGPMGVLLKNNIKALWWQAMVQERDDVVGLDSAILTKREVLQASGHEQGFSDPLVECKICHERFRADHQNVIDDHFKEKHKGDDVASNLTSAQEFNLMFKTFMGVIDNENNLAYLRPETAQGIFINYKQVMETSRLKLPFGIAQIGKSFRNEITPGNFIFRTREFEQMEMEYFVKPDEAEKHFEGWTASRLKWYQDLGINEKKLRLREHEQSELAHYANRAQDVEYEFPFGWSELEGIANRGDFDLKTHEKHSGKDLQYFDEVTREKFHPYVIEPAAGVDRATLAFIVDSYQHREGGDVVLKLHPKLAPIKVAVFPLVNKDRLPQVAKDICTDLRKLFMVQYDASGSVGRRYRRQDEIGTPWCVTVDFDSLEDNTVTVRDRDTMEQTRVKIIDLKENFEEKLN